MQFAGFGAKTTKLHSSQNSWPIGTCGSLEQNFLEFFFSFKKIFPIFLGPLNMLSVSFGAKMPTLYSGQNALLDGQKGIFLQTLPLFFFYLFYRLFHVFLRSLNILPTCFQEKMVTLHFGRNSWPVGTRGIFV